MNLYSCQCWAIRRELTDDLIKPCLYCTELLQRRRRRQLSPLEPEESGRRKLAVTTFLLTSSSSQASALTPIAFWRRGIAILFLNQWTILASGDKEAHVLDVSLLENKTPSSVRFHNNERYIRLTSHSFGIGVTA